MKSHKKLLSLFLEPPGNMTDSSFVMLYFIVAVFPSFLIACFSTIVINLEEVKYQAYLPETGRSITAVLLSPWIETLIFFAPAGLFLTLLRGGKLWCKLILVAFIFTAYHFLWGERSIFLAIFIFWAGIVMAYAFDISKKNGRKSIRLISYIHALSNCALLLLQYSAYGLTQLTVSFTTKMSVLILLELLFVSFMFVYLKKICKTSIEYEKNNRQQVGN